MKQTILFLQILSFLFLSLSCREEARVIDDRYIRLDDAQKNFASDFESTFGTPDKEMTWITSKEYCVEVDLSELPSSEYTLRFFTDIPTDCNSRAFLLAEYKNVTNLREKYEFDFPIGKREAYVTAESIDGVIYGAEIIVRGEKNLSVLIPNTEQDLCKEIEPMHYTLCFEGYTNKGLDYDYNDIVLEITYVRGYDSMPITLRTAGTDCKTQIVFLRDKNNNLEDIIFEEAHEAFGYPAVYSYATKHDIYYILNTGYNDCGKTAKANIDLRDDKIKPISDIVKRIKMKISIDESKDYVYYGIPEEKGSPCAQAMLLSVPNWNFPPEGMWIDVPHPDFIYWMCWPNQYPLWYTTMWNDAEIPG